MICPACHTENADPSKTCTVCGQDLEATLAPGSVIDSRYEILGHLGSGGMGVVYRALDRTLDEVVALKVLRTDPTHSPEMARRFRSEIKLARKVSHWNVCRIHEYGEHGRLLYISMELLEGIDLKRLLREQGPLPGHEAYEAAVQVCEGLSAIHRVGIVHRDLKTSNLIRDAGGVVRVMDFGIAKSFEREGVTGLTATGHIVGTPEYMSPEQARGARIDARSDIYSLGVVVFELFTGQVPFRGDTPLATILKHLQEPPPLEGPKATRLPVPLVPPLRRALSKNAEDRQASATEFAQDLRTAWATSSLGAATAATLPRAEPAPERVARLQTLVEGETLRPPPLRRPAWAGFAGLALALLAIAILLRQTTAPTAPTNTDLAPRAAAPRLSAVARPTGTTPGSPIVPPTSPPRASRAAPRAGAPTPTTVATPTVLPARPIAREATPVAALAPTEVTVPVGASLIVRINTELRSDRSRPGQEFEAALEEPLLFKGRELAPAGSPLRGRLETAGMSEGSPKRPFMELSLTQIGVKGGPLPIRTAYYKVIAPAPSPSSSIGAIVVGAAAGAAEGATLGKPNPTEYSVGNRLTFRLAEPLTLRVEGPAQ